MNKFGKKVWAVEEANLKSFELELEQKIKEFDTEIVKVNSQRKLLQEKIKMKIDIRQNEIDTITTSNIELESVCTKLRTELRNIQFEKLRKFE